MATVPCACHKDGSWVGLFPSGRGAVLHTHLPEMHTVVRTAWCGEPLSRACHVARAPAVTAPVTQPDNTLCCCHAVTLLSLHAPFAPKQVAREFDANTTTVELTLGPDGSLRRLAIALDGLGSSVGSGGRTSTSTSTTTVGAGGWTVDDVGRRLGCTWLVSWSLAAISSPVVVVEPPAAGEYTLICTVHSVNAYQSMPNGI